VPLLRTAPIPGCSEEDREVLEDWAHCGPQAVSDKLIAVAELESQMRRVLLLSVGVVLVGLLWSAAGNRHMLLQAAQVPGTTESDSGTVAPFYFPASIAVDVTGNVYIADHGTSRVREVKTDGSTAIIAGTGVAGFSGDGGSAVSAQLNKPLGIAIDSSGSIYLADTGNERVRRISPTGTITTVAGSGVEGFSGDGGPAIAAQFRFPTTLSADRAGNLYIADTGNHRVRKVTSDNQISTLIGCGGPGIELKDCLPENVRSIAPFFAPYGIATDDASNVYITAPRDSAVLKVTSGGDVTAVSPAQFRYPLGIAVGPAGTIYVADRANARLRRIMGAEVIDLPTVPGQWTPYGVAVDAAGTVYASDTVNGRVDRITAEGRTISVASPADFPDLRPPAPLAGVEHVTGPRSAVTPATVLSRKEPQYSELARLLGFQGTVTLEAIVRKDGTARIVRVARPLGFGLDENAVSALGQWTFRPGTKNGEPVDIALNIVVNFHF
jgi:TonB family protein